MSGQDLDSPLPRRHGWLKLTIAGGILVALWLTVLPKIAHRPHVAARIRRLEELGIDPTAIFYSELDAMPAFEERIRRARDSQPDVLW